MTTHIIKKAYLRAWDAHIARSDKEGYTKGQIIAYAPDIGFIRREATLLVWPTERPTEASVRYHMNKLLQEGGVVRIWRGGKGVYLPKPYARSMVSA